LRAKTWTEEIEINNKYIGNRTQVTQSGAQQVKGKVNFTLHSCYNKYSASIKALILKQITGIIPTSKVSLPDFFYLQHLQLQDPNFYFPGEIDILLGAELSDEIIMEGRVAGPCGLPSARNSELGWIVSGPVSNSPGQQLISNASTLEVDSYIKRFWEIEDLSSKSTHSKKEQDCEDHLINTQCR
jgi:hypothetical protein